MPTKGRPKNPLTGIPGLSRRGRETNVALGFAGKKGELSETFAERLKSLPYLAHPSDAGLPSALLVITSSTPFAESDWRGTEPFHLYGDPTQNSDALRGDWILSEADAEAAVGRPLILVAYDRGAFAHVITGMDERGEDEQGRMRQRFTIRPALPGEDEGWLDYRFEWLAPIQRTIFYKPKR